MQRQRRWWAVVGAIAMMVLAACTVSQVDWKNASYVVACPGLGTPAQKVQLHNGEWNAGPAGISSLHVRLETNIRADVTGNGRADEVLLMGCNIGASGYANEVLVYTDGPTLVARLAAPPLVSSGAYHPQFSQVWVSGGRIHATAWNWAPNDPHVAPSILLTITYRWTGHAFVVSQWSSMKYRY